jgi:hypothetical protein
MQIPKKSLHYLCLACAGISLLLCSGCVTPVGDYKATMAYQPIRSPIQFDASATVEATVTVSPEAVLPWGKGGSADQKTASYCSARECTLRNDIVKSGLFARIETGDKVDFAVSVNWVIGGPASRSQIPAPDKMVGLSSLFQKSEDTPVYANETCSLSVTETATGAKVTTQSREYSGGSGAPMASFMASLRAELAANLQAYLKGKKAQADKDLFAKASLTELIAGMDKTAVSANERNQAIIVAKNKQLPGLLREKKTEELSALVITIEQTTLTLNHEGELATDHAQQLTAAGGNAQQIDELRGLAISYQERIELLKPITVAIKDEIANRNR